MKKFLRLLRLEYAFFWAMPYFLGLIYLKSVYSVEKLDVSFLIAALFLTASVNVHNDLCEGKLHRYSKAFLKTIIMLTLLDGLVIFPNVLVGLALLVTYLYNWKLNRILYVDLLPSIAPGLAVLGILEAYNPFLLSTVVFVSIAAQSGQQLIDRDVRNKNYFYVYVFSYIISLLSFSAVLLTVNVALSWMLFIMAVASLVTISKTENRKYLFGKLTHATIQQRKSIIVNAWVMLIFLVGWYFLITL